MFYQRRVFTLSLGDILDADVPIAWRALAWRTIHLCRNVQWIIGTKRWSALREELRKIAWDSSIKLSAESRLTHGLAALIEAGSARDFQGWVEWEKHWPANVFIMASAGTNRHISHVLRWAERWPQSNIILSCEPMLEQVSAPTEYWKKFKGVIVGGESHHEDPTKAAPCDVTWIQKVVEECALAAVPVFVKQLGDNPTKGGNRIPIKTSKGGNVDECPPMPPLKAWPREWPFLDFNPTPDTVERLTAEQSRPVQCELLGLGKKAST